MFKKLILVSAIALMALAQAVAAVVQPVLSALSKVAHGAGERVYIGLTRLMQRNGLMLMANFPADIQTMLDGPVYGQPLTNRLKANRVGGRIRLWESIFRAPSSGTAPAIGDKIIWGRLPVKARLLGHLSRLDFNAGTASCTINLGDQFLATRHLAATAINAAGSATPSAAVFSNTATADTTINSNVLTNVKSIGAFSIGDLVTGTGIATASYVTGIDYVAKTVTLALAATATNAAQTMTVVGSAYETQDDTSNLANGYASATDDCTLISVVAGAQVANNQIITLKMAYTLD